MDYRITRSPGARILRHRFLRLQPAFLFSVAGLSFVHARTIWLQEHPLMFAAFVLCAFGATVVLAQPAESEEVLQKTPGQPEYYYSRLYVRTEYVEGVAVLRLHGNVGLGEGHATLKLTLRELLEGGHTKIVLNLNDVGYIDSVAIGDIVRAYTDVSRAGGEMKIVNLGTRILTLSKVVTTFESENAAIDSFLPSSR